MAALADHERNTELKAELKSELKQELQSELTAHINEEVDDAVEEEIQDEVRKLSRYRAFGAAKGYLFAIAATIIALGQFSEAVSLIESGVNKTLSRFTHEVEYQRLAKINVGNTEAYTLSLLGSPQVSRPIDAGVTANYFHDPKYLLTVFIQENRVVAYTVLPLTQDFHPPTLALEETEWSLQVSSFKQYPTNPEVYLVDHSKTASYYLESLDNGRIGLFFKTYLGNVELADYHNSALLVDLYNKDVNELDEAVFVAQEAYREQTAPNFYGMGILSLEAIQKSLLTGAEYAIYFGASR